MSPQPPHMSDYQWFAIKGKPWVLKIWDPLFFVLHTYTWRGNVVWSVDIEARHYRYIGDAWCLKRSKKWIRQDAENRQIRGSVGKYRGHWYELISLCFLKYKYWIFFLKSNGLFCFLLYYLKLRVIQIFLDFFLFFIFFWK